MTTLSTKPCTCGHTMTEIVDYVEHVRKGWWCSVCNAWDDAIGRERVIRVKS